MSFEFKDDKINALNKEAFIKIQSQKDGRTFNVREFTYGVLAHDAENPLCCASQANSSISIDLWKGCQWQCAYCHVQGSQQDWTEGKTCMGSIPEKRSKFEVTEILDALLNHPFFIPNETVISIGTASTEPFSPIAVESTFQIMDYFVSHNLRNPFWIVTKSAFPSKYTDRLKKIVKNGNTVLISICWANNPANIEPMRNDRFQNIEKIKEAGAHTSWYLRPLAEGWSTDTEDLTKAFQHASKYKDYIDMVIPGGLRWTEGIEYALEEIKSIPLPHVIKDDNTKFLPEETVDLIQHLHKKYLGTDKPLYFKSSCSLSNLLSIPNLNLAQIRNTDECTNSLCPLAQRNLCASYKLPTVELLNERIRDINLGEIKIKAIDSTGNITTDPSLDQFPFAIRQKIYHELAKK